MLRVAFDEVGVHRGTDPVLVIEPEHVAQLVRDDECHRVTILSALNADLRADEASSAALDVRVARSLEPANPDQHLGIAT